MRRPRGFGRWWSTVVIVVCLGSPARAGQEAVALNAPPAAGTNPLIVIDGPPPPTPPAIIARDASGRATIRAVPLSEPLRLDGRLDEELYHSVPPISDFVQMEPEAGAPATQRTEVWVSFDQYNVYVSFRCWESEPDRMIANEMRHDNNNIGVSNDAVGFMFDTFYDRRNSLLFNVNPLGGRTDGEVSNERQYNADWNPIWQVEVGRFDGGWTVEAAVPFKSIRYAPGHAQVWGFNARRTNRWKNEISHIVPVSNALGIWGLTRSTLVPTLVGLEAPAGAKNLELKPYVVSNLASDFNATPRIANDVDAHLGFDFKYGVSQNVTADFTYNTDFAQVEADEQQINLTRFSLFFPEKRDFFLENAGMFGFGGGGGTGTGGGGGDTPIIFYSRRIGLDQGRIVPIEAGGRLTGRIGRYSVGLLDIQTGREVASGSDPTNFSVARIRRDILRRSSVGFIATSRSIGQNRLGRNSAYGADTALALLEDLNVNVSWARTQTEGLPGQDTSYRGQLDYSGDRYGVQLERLYVGANFNPEVGFVRRRDMRRSFGLVRFSPRPRDSAVVRKYSATGSFAYIENATGRVETRDRQGDFAVDFQNSDRLDITYSRTYEFLPAPFPIAPDVTIPIGGYDHESVRTSYLFGPQRKLSGTVAVERGAFYSGHKTTFAVSRGRVNLSPQLSIEPAYSIDRVELREGAFTNHLASSRITYTMTPLMFVSTLVQYNSGAHVLAANVRLRWEYRPGSELFVVYNDNRDTLAPGFPDLANRAFIVKVNRLLRY